MAFHLTVAGTLEPLADVLAGELSAPLPDPFAREVVVVPGDGVKRWLTERLARNLGARPAGGSSSAAPDGIVANIDFVFPATLVGRALGEESGLGRWSVGPLTWAVFAVLSDRGGDFGQPADAVRARAIADLFDRYSLYRQDMVIEWSQDSDVDVGGRLLADHHRWQPRLWRAVQQHLGGLTDAQRMRQITESLQAGTAADGFGTAIPERVFLFGLASLPPQHLQVIGALSTRVDVHVLAPAASPARWHRARAELRLPLPVPVRRGAEDGPSLASEGGHPLVSGWGGASREANILLLDVADRVPAIVGPPAESPVLPDNATLLARLQYAIRADLAPPGAPPPGTAGADDPRPLLDPADTSVRWHRAYGPARQVEVLRDSLLHLLEERNPDGSATYQPRDIAVLCPDLTRFAGLVEATFAGDPGHGIPSLPVRIADRSLRQDDPLLDAAAALIDLIDGRFNATEVLSFASRPTVGRTFHLDRDALSRIAQWAHGTNVRWGLGPADHRRFGLPVDLEAHTWRAGLDQLLLGATMADAGPRVGAGGVAPYADVEGNDVEIVGHFADLIDRLERAMLTLSVPSTVESWCDALADAVTTLCAVPDDEAWRWHTVERVISDFRSDAAIFEADGSSGAVSASRDDLVDPVELALLMRARLAGGGGRPRFGTGAITFSALAPQRGVPHRVVCLLGFDRDIGAGGIAVAEDLVAVSPCVGDRDVRGEQRAQFLDAVLSAGERLMVFTTGHDLRTNVELPPVVAVAELFDVIDATVRGSGKEKPSVDVAVDHPRQAWSDPAFIPDALGLEGPWSFDAGALEAAEARRHQVAEVGIPGEPLPPPSPSSPAGRVDRADGLAEDGRDGDVDAPEPRIELADLLTAVTEPAKVLVDNRLGITIHTRSDDGDDVIPLTLSGLAEWGVADAWLQTRLRASATERAADADQWASSERARGAVPPLAFGNEAIAKVAQRVDGLMAALDRALGGRPYQPMSVAVDVAIHDLEGRRLVVEGSVSGVCDDLVIAVTASGLKDRDLLKAWVRVAALTLHDPSRSWQAVTFGRDGRPSKKDSLAVQRVSMRSPELAADALAVVADLWRRACCDAVPAFPATTRALHIGGRGQARTKWNGYQGTGDRDDRWNARLFDLDFDDLLRLPGRPDELVDRQPAPSRLAFWAERIWDTVERTAMIEEDPIPSADPSADPVDVAPSRGDAR